jgi:uncharacterized Zn finger protein (UPF0148 family)
VTRICPRCSSMHSLVTEDGTLLCCLCGWRPQGVDPGAGTQSAHVMGPDRPGAEHHTKGVAVS